MRKPVLLLFVTVLLAACSQAAAPNAGPVSSSPAVVQSTSAPQAAAASSVPTAASSIPSASSNCTVLSKEEVGTILGEAVVEVRDPAKDGSLCVYQTQSLILEFNTQTVFGGFVDSVNFMQQMRANFNNSGDTTLDVPGLGDESFYHGGSGTIRALLVRKGGNVYSFAVRNITADYSLSSPDNAETMEKALAVLLLTRLP